MRTVQRPFSLLEHALLGLVRQNPASGYDLRKIFSTTPMGSFSDSPGAIYPALRRLEGHGLIQGRVQERSGLRRRNVFSATAAGKAELRRWLARPLAREDVVSRMDEVILRFAFMEAALGRRPVEQFLRQLEGELAAYVPTLRAHLTTHRATMPDSAWLALDFGIRSYEAHLEWCRQAMKTYSATARRGP
jgi:DNA-binding PadR family transcriptional regulator